MSKHKPDSREEFKQLILRKLGSPVIKINVSDDQINDCIEDALKYFNDYHFDGNEHVYYSHLVTSTDIANRYITIPEEIHGVVDVYTVSKSGFAIAAANQFSGGYQVALDLAFNASSGTLLSFYLNKMSYEFMNQMIVGEMPVRFNRHLNKINIDTNWANITEGTYVVVDGYRKLVPNDSSDQIWNDRWLIKYATAKVKWVWGNILAKYDGIQLPGSAAFNGTKIQDDAVAEIQALEDEMISTYSMPVRDFTG